MSPMKNPRIIGTIAVIILLGLTPLAFAQENYTMRVITVGMCAAIAVYGPELFPTALRVLNDFRVQLKAGVERPVFDPRKFADLDIDETAWPHARKLAGEEAAGPAVAAPARA